MQYVLNKPVKRLGKTFEVGTMVYLYTGYDYGLSLDDSRVFGQPHVSVSEVEGKTPFFTVPVSSITRVQENKIGSEVIESMVETLLGRANG